MMETVGMVRIFQRSLSHRSVRYTSYIGDGDSKTFSSITASNPYGEDITVSKIECVGHVQKRMGTRLRKLKQMSSKLSDGKSIGGKGSCQVIYSQFGLAIHQNDHQARRRFVEWAQNEIDVVPDFHKRILFSNEAHFWLNGYVNKQNCRIWSEANPQVYVESSLHLEKLTVWCALWAGGILLQKR
ncbi:putative DD41D transposase [Trichonephila clavipes]|nr:putative DD41D transposase [Trichonephila clavipes]